MATRRSYTTLPSHLPGAAEFSDDRDDFDRNWVADTLNRHPEFLAVLRDALAGDGHANRPGRKATPGDFALAYLAYVDSAKVNLEPWWAKTTTR